MTKTTTIFETKPDQKKSGPTRLCVRCRRHAKVPDSAQKIMYGKRIQWVCEECIAWLNSAEKLRGAGPTSVGGRKKPKDAEGGAPAKSEKAPAKS